MSEVNIIFSFNGLDTNLQCLAEDKLKNIIEKYIAKAEIDRNKVDFFYYGNKLDEELTCEEIIDLGDDINDSINIIVSEKEDLINENIYLFKDIICPKCENNTFLTIEDYKIKMNCKCNHEIDNILINEFIDEQKKAKPQLICNICKGNKKDNMGNNSIYSCKDCHNNICSLCKYDHDKSHKLINYDDRNFICNIHNEIFSKYCENCKKDICSQCENNHKSHNSIDYKNILENENDYLKELRNYIDRLNIDIKEIIKKLEFVMKNMELYYEMSYGIINIKNKNYYIMQNINECLETNESVLNDLKEISGVNLSKKIINIMKIYNKMNNNFILGELYIEENNEYEKIRIINSFEQYKRDNGYEKEKDDFKNENEKEIKKCKILIDNKQIAFTYFYKFNKRGKHTIKYVFNDEITNTDYMFYGCEYLDKLDLSNFESENVANMGYMFAECKSLREIDLSNFKTNNAENMEGLFSRCEKLYDLNLSNFITKNVSNMNSMFIGCNSLYSLNLSNFDTKNVFNMGSMFYDCQKLTKLDLSNFNTQNVNYMKYIFSYCYDLKGENVKTKDKKILNTIY